MNINKDAPLIGKQEIIIDAPVEEIWRDLTQIDEWPKWQKEISFATLEGALKKGSKFSWKAMGMTIKSELQEVQENKVISWTGDSIGMHAIHIWTLEKEGTNTRVATEESLSGWLASIIGLFKSDYLEESLQKSLEALKVRIEN